MVEKNKPRLYSRTNVCVATCLFCSFSRLRPGDPGSYTLALEEAWEKLRRGLFIEIRIHTMPEIIAGLVERGLEDWSQVAFATEGAWASRSHISSAT